MTNVAVIGSQWGDEGKGKIVDWLSVKADVVVRFQGGHNAGHTLVIDGNVYKLSLLPSGVVRPGKISIIGNGVVIDPFALLREMEAIRERGVSITPETLYIADNAPLILPLHQQLDKAAEAARGSSKIGTTGRGIGPAYEDKVARRAIRVADLGDDVVLEERIEALAAYHNMFRKGAGIDLIDARAELQQLKAIRDQILPYARPVWRELDRFAKSGARILFEGAQGAMLDCDHGTYPFVTSSNTMPGAAFVGSGLGLRHIGYVLGITKAYTTRVGSGPFPTELTDAVGKGLGERGHEFGTVTGRQRRCGWFDAVMVRQACTLAGVNGIALTKLDVLDGEKELKIATSYRLGDQVLDYLPAGISAQAGVVPVYETLEGWSQSTRGARSYKDLPANAIKYITRIEELIGVPVAILSTSPERDDTILMRDPFSD